MKKMKKTIMGLVIFLLLILLTVPTSAATKKSSKPIVRIVNGTILTHYPGDKKIKDVKFKFFAKKKGKWVVKETHTLKMNREEAFVYEEVMKNGNYAVTATVDNLKESDKKTFKVSNVGKNDSPDVYKQNHYANDAYRHYAIFVRNETVTGKRIEIFWEPWHDYVTWQLTVSAYYIDSKGKLQFMDNKPIKFKNNGGIHSNETYFKPIKGQRDYAFAQVNHKGKKLGYLYVHYDEDQTKLMSSHFGHPSKSMNFNKSDWKYIDGYLPKTR